MILYHEELFSQSESKFPNRSLEKGGVTMIPSVLMEGATASSAVADVVSTVMATVSSITAHPLVAAAIAVPLTGSVIGLCKRLFSH